MLEQLGRADAAKAAFKRAKELEKAKKREQASKDEKGAAGNAPSAREKGRPKK